MMKDFRTALRHCSRKIVIHETCCYDDQHILNVLQQNDMLFLDDCLYSQYIFLMKNINALKDKSIACVLGFSTSIFRREGRLPTYDAHCADCHDRVHNGDVSAYDAYMSIAELKQLLTYENVFLACHGDCHLELAKCNSKIKQLTDFKKDIADATQKLQMLELSTCIFVYPYAYDDILLADKVLRSHSYEYLFAGHNSRRIQFENIINREETNYE